MDVENTAGGNDLIETFKDASGRRIFFPDTGDEIVAGIHMLRLTRDWDEVTDEWKPQGSWFFLELIEADGPDWSLPVSIKQIWYDVRLKSGFEKLKDWTSSVHNVWRELVLHVLLKTTR
ncbi:Histone acetyltransferase [Olea europaea subsp. europaea]|uniref:Histone acetyltransferase n=1 Tax=Olea europaea subsp. europaea TaxID=158383 RepID=A0A8S0PGB1_OLEEU|nr:Histone acetyltransferase [Olea europaea subsp. europaea]